MENETFYVDGNREGVAQDITKLHRNYIIKLAVAELNPFGDTAPCWRFQSFIDSHEHEFQLVKYRCEFRQEQTLLISCVLSRSIVISVRNKNSYNSFRYEKKPIRHHHFMFVWPYPKIRLTCDVWICKSDVLDTSLGLMLSRPFCTLMSSMHSAHHGGQG